jgi:tRNA threonylcarbamoyl adenosine modification protein YeaZ
MILVIDTATAACSVALIGDGQVLAERHEVVGRGHAERLVPMIQELLEDQRASSILVDCGPGSFTGVRVGLAAAQGLAIGWHVPVTGYSSLALIAACAKAEHEVAIALHGGHGQLFVQSYGYNPVEPLDELRSLLPADAAAAIKPARVMGSAAEMLVSLRGYGEAREGEIRASGALRLPNALKSLPPKAIYGRAPDAKPMQ